MPGSTVFGFLSEFSWNGGVALSGGCVVWSMGRLVQASR